MKFSLTNFCFLFCVFLSFQNYGQQQADVIEIPDFKNPKFTIGKGPKVFIDQTHNNFHTMSGRFKPFADLIAKDGYQVDSLTNFSQLETNDVLVISNALNHKNIGNWQRPIYSAFSENDIQKIKDWVSNGGSLLLIADHMPMAGAVNTLAQAFGFEFCDGFAFLKKEKQNLPDVFSIENKRYLSNEIISKNIDNITTFTGSSFSIPEKAIGILKFTKEDYCLAPEIAWRFNKTTKKSSLANKYQGAVLNFGKGKIAVFGEAAMFTAQTITNNSGTFKFGFHAPQAPNNIQFIRDILYWLSNT